jgi:SOS response regulatory protein OraA/RecX
MSPRTDRKDAKAVLTVIKQLRDETYRVKKSDKDKYSIQRKLQYRGYKLLRDPELLKEVDGPDSDLPEYIDRYLR